MALITLGSWQPDAASLGSDALDVAQNVYPGPASWLPVPQLVSQTAALPAACKGFVKVIRSDGTAVLYAGTATDLYVYDVATNTWTSKGSGYSVPADGFWCFAPFGTRLLATNGNDAIQYVDIDAGGSFATLGGTPEIAKFITVIQDRVVLSGLANYPRDIAWSDTNDSEAWTPGVDGLADQQTFAGLGAVMGPVCGYAGLIFFEEGQRGIVPTGDTNSFTFPEIAGGIGTTAPNSVKEIGSVAFWLGPDAFYAGNSGGSLPISANVTSRYFFANLNNDRKWQVQTAQDPTSQRVLFAYTTGDTEYNDRILPYDRSLGPADGWSEINVITYILGQTATAGQTLESLDNISGSIDALGFSLDSLVWKGNAPALGAIDEDLNLSHFEGTPMAATLTTGAYALSPGRRSRVQWVSPYVEGADGEDATVAVGKRQRLADDWTTTSAIAQQTSGRCPFNADGKFHRFTLAIPAGSDWDHALGLDVEFRATGVR